MHAEWRRRLAAVAGVALAVIPLVTSPASAQSTSVPELGLPPGPVVDTGLRAAAETAQQTASPPWIDTNNRSAVANRYRAVFNVAEPAANWNGNVSSCQAGTLSSGYRQAILDRINWYRAMAGVPEGVVEYGPFTSDAQESALISAANGSLSHDPPSTWTCWTEAGKRGASKSNLYLGLTGVRAVDGFVEDPGASNTAVGHRSWFLEPTQKRMGVGAVPTGPKVSESIYVIDSDNLWGAPPALRQPDGFVSWPPPGYVPRTTVYPRWSLHHLKGDFTNASVSVTVDGVPVSATVEHRSGNASSRPGPHITFVPAIPAVAATADQTVSVTVSGIAGTGVPTSYSWSTTIIPSPTGTASSSRAAADFDGDGDTDIGVYRPANSVWFLRGGATTPYGTVGDIPVPGDYDGDNDSDVAVYRPSAGFWFVDGGAGAQFGLAGDVPVPGNYDGDSDTEMAVFRPGSGTWFVRGGNTVQFGTVGDVPVPGDYDGDGDTDIGVYRPATGTWFVHGRATAVEFGTAGDIPVPADYDGDRDTDMAVFRPATGSWFVNGGSTSQFGTTGDVPVPGDYDGDGDAEVAVFRPSIGYWFVSNGPTVGFGTVGDAPLPLPAAIHRTYFPVS